MKKFYLGFLKLLSFVITLQLTLVSSLTAQQLNRSSFVIFGVNGVQFSSSNTVTGGGSVGSNTLVNSPGGIAFPGSINSGGKITLGNGTSVAGKTTAANVPPLSGNILLAGSSAVFNGDIVVNGGLSIAGATVASTAKIYQPSGASYVGPGTASKALLTDQMPIMPAMPTNTSISVNNTKVNSTTGIGPGTYGDVTLSGNKTLTLNGPGVYKFKSFTLTNSNQIIFNFAPSPTSGKFYIFVNGTMLLDKVGASFVGLPAGKNNKDAAARIYTEVQGVVAAGVSSFVIANGSTSSTSKWLGTVWASGGNINVGSGTGNSDYTGALWSGKAIIINSGVNVIYSPLLVECVNPTASINNGAATSNIPCDQTSIQLTGSTNISGATYSWTTLDDKGNIVADTDGNPATVTVTTAGKYILNVTNSDGCTATDDISVTSCINDAVDANPFKVFTVVDARLTQLSKSSDYKRTPYLFTFNGTDSSRVLIEAILTNNSIATATSALNVLGSLGFNTENYGPSDISNNSGYYIITGFFPISNLANTALENPSLFKYIRAVTPPVTFTTELTGTYNTLGDSAMGSRPARKGYDISGASFKDASGISKQIKIGVLSDSYNKKLDANIDAGNNDLPNIGTATNPIADVELPDGDYPFSFAKSDEGRAMLEIVHDVAPGARLAFRTGFVSEGDMADGIRRLRDVGCNIIVDDITYATTPYFKDGLVTKAVKQVTSESNVIYFTSAGNFGNKSFEGSFSPSVQNGKAIPLSGTDTLQSIKLNGTGVNHYMIVLQWNDEFYSANFGGSTPPVGAAVDLDIYLTDYTGKNILGYNQVNTGSDPLEILPFTADDKTTVYLKIVKAGGPISGPSMAFKYILFRGNAEIVNNPNPNPTTIIGHASSNAAITVGAVQFNLTPAFGVAPENIKVESFSSWGGPINNTDNRKPDISAPDGVNTSVDMDGNLDRPIKNLDGSVYINLPAPGYNAFYGTSAAAPHAAGLAALLMEARSKFNFTNNPNYSVYTPASMKAVMKSTATNIITANEQTGGFDYQSGSGLLDAYKALLTEANPTPVITKIVSITTTDPPIIITEGPNAGKIKIVLVVEGDYLVSDSYLKIGETTVIPESIDLTTKTIVAYIEPFTGNPLVSVCSPASSTSGLDGQCSVPKNILDQARTEIRIKARDANKYYGQDLPAFGYDFQIKLPTESSFGAINVLPAGLTLADLGLTKIDPVSGGIVSTVKFNTSATNNSDASSTAYSIIPFIEGFDPVPIEKAVLFDYQYVNGFLTINRLKIKITPENQTIAYGQEPQKVIFKYESVDGIPLLNDPVTGKNVLDEVKTEHNLYLDQTDAYALVRGDLALLADNPNLYDNLAMMITEAGIAQAKLNGGGARANGGGARANVVDVTPQALENFFLSRATILNGGGARANGIPYEDATWSSNGGGARANGGGARANAVVNGDAMINGFVIFNGLPGDINTYGTANGIRYVSGGARANGGGARANGTARANYILFDPINNTTVRANVVVNSFNYSFADILLTNVGSPRANVCDDCLAGGYEISNGTVRSNGESVVNTELFSGISNSNVAVLVNDLDIKNGEIPGYKSINMFTGLTATNNGNHKIIPGAYLPAKNNYDITYGMGDLTVTKAPMTLKADNQLGKTYGEAVAFSSTATEYVYDMETDILDNVNVVFPGTITYDVYNGPTKIVGPIYPVLAGNNKYTIKQLYTDPANYVVTPINGDLTIVKANQTITWNNPVNVPYGTKLSSTQLNATVTGVTGGSAPGLLTYTPATGTLLSFGSNTLKVDAAATVNYEAASKTVIQIVDKANLTVTMGQSVYFYNQGSSLPNITSTITGLAIGESVSNTYITDGGVTVTSSLAAGVYTITRKITASTLPTFNNYNILTTANSTAILYVNPSGGNTKSIRPILDCIEPDGSNYRAKYSWVNDNSATVFVPLGDNNKIVLSPNAVVYSGAPPEVFPPGTGVFYVRFNGVKISWLITSISKTKSSSSSMDATSTSNKCNSGGSANTLSKAMETDVVIRETVYPNPATNQVFIEGDFSKVSEKDVMIVDGIGRQMKPASIQKLSSRRMQINISNLYSSQYYITVNTATGKKLYKFIKL